MLELFSAQICPFAQRTRSLLRHLDIPFERREVDLADKSPAFTAISPTGKVPLLVDGDTLLYESKVIAEYIAEKYAWTDALPADPAGRARVRLAMKQFDDVVIGGFYKSVFAWGKTKVPGVVEEPGKIAAELRVLERTFVDLVPEGPSLAAFHVGPFWTRMTALRELSTFAETLVDPHPTLRRQFDRTAALPTVRDTSIPAGEMLATYKHYAEINAGK